MEYQEYLQAVQDQMTANNQWSALQAQKQMDFQKEMSDTAHQREVADLQAAGLNPVLSAHGNGASTPNGAMASNNGDLNAYAGFLATILDTENANARANLMAATKQATSSSAKGNSSLLTDLLMAFGMNRSQAQGVGNTVNYLIGDLDILNDLNKLQEVAVAKATGNTQKTTTDNSGVTWKTSSAQKTDTTAKASWNYFKDSITQTAKNIWDSITTPFKKSASR